MEKKVNQEKNNKEKKADDYQVVEIEKLNTLIVIPNNSKTISYFPLNLKKMKYSFEKFSEKDFEKINKKQLENDFAKIESIIQESRFFEERVITLEIFLIGLFFILAAYNNIFTFRSKDFKKIEIMPTVVTGVILVVFLIFKAIKYYVKKENDLSKGEKFQNLKKKVENLISDLNKQRYSDIGFELSVNKYLGFIKIKKK